MSTVGGAPSLCSLLAAEREVDATVAWRRNGAHPGDQAVSWQDFCAQVRGLRDRVLGGPRGQWLVACDDAYACAVGLLGLWHAGSAAVFSPNSRAQTLSSLANRTAGVLSDRPDLFGPGAAIDPLGFRGEASLAALDRDAIALELFTSGSTGDGKRVVKRIRHLEDEVRCLEEMWGPALEGCTVFSTASHHHLYGLLFGVLWPLAAGRPFHGRHFLHAPELAARLPRAGEGCLASVPAHLRRLAQDKAGRALRGRLRMIFSSGGLLPAETASAVERTLHEVPVEVFGSTETGGVAWRRQPRGSRDPAWTPLPAVTVERDPSGVARVRSPFVSADSGEAGFAMGDRIEQLPDGRFRLGGRADRMVKVGEKRLDLAAMESDLRTHPHVADCALLLAERGAGARVAAVVVLTDAGARALGAAGHLEQGRTLASHLAPRWDATMLPRTWRFVTALPEDAQGKVIEELLREEIERGARGMAPPRSEDRPSVLEETAAERTLERRCRVPRDLACFAGHFPGFPLVPGVLQLDWVMEIAAALTGFDAAIEELLRVKFGEVLRPGDDFRVRVELEDDRLVRFRLWSERGEHAVGRLRLAERQDP